MQVGYRQTALGCQGIELAGGRENVPVDRNHLSFLDHVHKLNALQSDSGRKKGFEAQHRSNHP
jgi:hypothetical protein